MLTSFMEKFLTESQFDVFESRMNKFIDHMEDFVLEMRDFKLEARSNFETVIEAMGHYSKTVEERIVTKEYLDKRLQELKDQMHGTIRTHERIMHA